MADPGDWPYERRPAGWQRLLLDRHADRAEWSVPAGRLGGVIRQLRRRGRAARGRATLFMWALFLTVVLGLAYYLLLPFWSLLVDGRRAALNDSIAASDRIGTELDLALTVLRDDVAAALAQAIEAVPLPDGADLVWMRGAAVVGETVLIYGTKGTILTYDIASGTLSNLRTPGTDDVWFSGHAESGPGALLIYGNGDLFSEIGGTILRYDIAAKALTELRATELNGAGFTGHAQAGPGALLIYGTKGTILTYDIASGTLSGLRTPGTDGVSFEGHAEAGSGKLLIYGDEGTILTYDNASGTLSDLRAPGTDRVEFQGHAEAGPGKLLIYGDVGTILTHDNASGTLSDLRTPGTDGITFYGHAEAGPGTLLLYGAKGAILTYGVASGRLGEPPLPETLDGVYIFGHVQAGAGETLFVGSAGVVRASDRLKSAAVAVAPLTDDSLQDFLDKVVPRHLQEPDAIRLLRQRLSDIIGQRKVAVASRDEAQRNLANLWTGFFPLQAQRIAFRDFMTDCRGSQDPPPAPEVAQQTTLACAAAWQAKLQADEGSVWQTLSERVPPGVLLLFLLGTLSGLYRYNLRLAGFHDSRADSLELLSLGREEDEVRAALDLNETDVLNRIAAAMAADKVAFNSARDPTDQAVDLAKGILSRQ